MIAAGIFRDPAFISGYDHTMGQWAHTHWGKQKSYGGVWPPVVPEGERATPIVGLYSRLRDGAFTYRGNYKR